MPDVYKVEVEFIENIRGNTYTDIFYKESKLRSIAHQLDKTLTLKKQKKMEAVVKTINNISSEIVSNPNHDRELIAWSRNIIAEFSSLLQATTLQVEKNIISILKRLK